ncbi:hypothetical protein PV08_08637 [Exophiala spinifera]|uniref:BZIP domain-containing protein n=1 Tax=Exophiala spinifera TaxID=91928 RepID=A0A0D2BQN9_9EURO|nr:uncharacterized protein PV08_08637 [Exophiala spinifera]KIW13449.1 hypothetical protein PV08_08637 [Exophiala spinifera]
MSRSNHDVVRDIGAYPPGDRETRKHIRTITEHRREQNRRAQRAFRERRRAKKQFLKSKPQTPRYLAPRVPDDAAVVSGAVKYSEAVNVPNWAGHTSASSTETAPPSASSHVFSDTLNLRDQRHPRSDPTPQMTFTFSSPQTLLPAHESLIPQRRTPTSELQAYFRATNRPGHTLWPQGVPATLAACLFNAAALGIDIDRVGDPKYMSPFYRPSFSATPSSSLVVQPTTTDESSTPTSTLQLPEPRSLRPCFAQVIFPHHACLDLLPLPKLREAAVMLVVRAQQEGKCVGSSANDEVQELKKDVYVCQGVRFRGTGDLRSDEYLLPDESAGHCGNPWEGGSWAVASWFAIKWKCLIDL